MTHKTFVELDDELIDYAFVKPPLMDFEGVTWLHINPVGDLESPAGAICQKVGLGKIVWDGPVLAMRDESGKLLCASSNRAESDTIRVGRHCDTCSDWMRGCKLHYRIAWSDMVCHKLCAMTLSRTSSLQYSLYIDLLSKEYLDPMHVITQIKAEKAVRTSTQQVYYRLGFRRLDGREGNIV